MNMTDTLWQENWIIFVALFTLNAKRNRQRAFSNQTKFYTRAPFSLFLSNCQSRAKAEAIELIFICA